MALVFVRMAYSFPPNTAWLPLPDANWNADAARHLLRRAGWTALADDVDRALREGLAATLDRLFPSDPPLLAKPRAVERLEDAAPALQREIRDKSGPDRLELQRELREHGRLALQDLSLKWLDYAGDPANASIAKWTLFLSDVYVVSAEKVQNAALIFQHFDILARHAYGRAPALTKAVLRSPAMVIYLDLNQSHRQAPNENFARELFELFLLGEGNYTERDIKEAARALTGYRAQPLLGEFRFIPAQHDPTPKTVFGVTGALDGDDVIDLAYEQPAAASFLPHEMVKFYLCDEPLPPAYLTALGEQWRANEFNLRWLAQRFFGSQLFYASEFRANFIKSPMQFYLGLLQDLSLDVAPLPRMNLNPMRQMGQWLFFPPNVRGWVGGRNWINSATITARRQLVEMLFAPINEKALNADEMIDLVAARSNGISNFTVADPELSPLANGSASETAGRLARDFLAMPLAPDLRNELAKFIVAGSHNPTQHLHAVRRTVASLLQSPEYQLC